MRRSVILAALVTLLGAACGTPTQEQSATTADVAPGSTGTPAASSTSAPAPATTAGPEAAWASMPDWAEPLVA